MLFSQGLAIVPAKSLLSSGLIGGGNPAIHGERHGAPAFAGATKIVTHKSAS